MEEQNKQNIRGEWTPAEADAATALQGEEGPLTDSCVEMVELLDWVDRGSASPYHEKMTGHVYGCPHCRRQYGELRKTLKAAETLKSMRPLAADQIAVAQRRAPVRNTRFRTISRAMALAASILVIGLCGLLVLHRQPAPTGQPPIADASLPPTAGAIDVASNQSQTSVSSDIKDLLASKYGGDGQPRIIGDDSTDNTPSESTDIAPTGSQAPGSAPSAPSPTLPDATPPPPSDANTRSMNSIGSNIQIQYPLPNESITGPNLTVKWANAYGAPFKVEIDPLAPSQPTLTAKSDETSTTVPNIRPGNYTVQVSSSGGQYSYSIQFHVLAPSEITELNEEEKQYAASDQLLGIVYERSHLYEQALDAYKSYYAHNPTSNVAKTTYNQYRAYLQHLSD